MDKVRKLDDLAIVINSCDKYSDLWETFFYFFNKNWPDCPFKRYLISNNIQPNINDVEIIKVGKDISWSNNLLLALKQLEQKYILFFLDDLFLIKLVDTERLVDVFKVFKSINGNSFKLISMPKPDTKFNEFFGIISPGALYRTTTVFSIWNRTILLKLLNKNENAWEFELNGSIRSDPINNFFSTYENMFFWIHGVIRGKWVRKSVKLIKSQGYEISINKRPVMGYTLSVIIFLRQIRAYLFKVFIPSKYRKKVRKIMFLKMDSLRK